MGQDTSATYHVEPEFVDFAGRVFPLVDATIEKLRQTKFREDPIGGRKYSRVTSIVSSAYKRHGQILENAILERLKDCPRLQTWREDEFNLSNDSLIEIRTHNLIEKILTIDLKYGDAERTIPIDIIVYDKEARTLCSYNVKRGNGSYDAGKRKIILEELLRTKMLMIDYGRHMGVEVIKAKSLIIFYYGLRSIPEPLSLVGAELDDHFRFPVVDAVEVVNEYFRQQLYRLIESE